MSATTNLPAGSVCFLRSEKGLERIMSTNTRANTPPLPDIRLAGSMRCCSFCQWLLAFEPGKRLGSPNSDLREHYYLFQSSLLGVVGQLLDPPND